MTRLVLAVCAAPVLWPHLEQHDGLGLAVIVAGVAYGMRLIRSSARFSAVPR